MTVEINEIKLKVVFCWYILILITLNKEWKLYLIIYFSVLNMIYIYNVPIISLKSTVEAATIKIPSPCSNYLSIKTIHEFWFPKLRYMWLLPIKCFQVFFGSKFFYSISFMFQIEGVEIQESLIPQVIFGVFIKHCSYGNVGMVETFPGFCSSCDFKPLQRQLSLLS